MLRLHNFVDIKIGIIHKNRKNIHFLLLLAMIYCIVTTLYEHFYMLCVVCYVSHSLWFCSRSHGGIPLIRATQGYQTKSLFWDPKLTVIIFWIIGFTFGFSFGYITPDTTISLMCSALCERVSIVGRIFSLFLPFFLSFIIIRKCVLLIMPLVAIKAYGLGFCLYCVTSAFGTAGWLMSTLCLSVDLCSTVLFLWFILCNLQESHKSISNRFTFCVIMSLLLGLLDHQIISPFAAKLLNY